MPSLRSASRYYRLSALAAERATREARAVRRRGTGAIGAVVVAHQVAQARDAEQATATMLAEQGIDKPPAHLLNSLAFTTSTQALTQMLGQVEADFQFNRLIGSLVQDAGRAAQGVAVAARPTIHYVRYVSLPCCSRCAVLAGKVYAYSTGFARHPGCDCSMIPTTVASPLHQNPHELVASGQVRGLSKADTRALSDGADLNQIVNVRTKRAGLSESGRALSRAGRPTPEGIYRATATREEAIAALRRYSYLR